MIRIRSFFTILFLSLSLAAAEDKISYAREILPILSDKCFYCHGPDKKHQKADLRLDIRAEAIAAGAIDPDHPEKSEILFHIFPKDEEEITPPSRGPSRTLGRPEKPDQELDQTGSGIRDALGVCRTSCEYSYPGSNRHNLPFDQFITEQLAGDLLESPTRDQRLATSFKRIHRKTNEGGSVSEEFHQDGISDRVHTVGTAFMALTFECSRCHDHKYDPITAKDYYSLGAFFNSIEEAGLIQGGEDRGSVLPQPALQLPTDDQENKLASLQSNINAAESALTGFTKSAEPEFQSWLTSPEHPLTFRVIINRIWQEIFGTGIVATSDNFGLQGAQPSHPALLDWLARDFIAHGWDQKRAIRQMLLSATYAQDSTTTPALRERDPSNALLARGPSRRLTAEMLRDSALALSGLLPHKIGGEPAMPYQAPGSMWEVLNNFLPEYEHDKGEGLYRRSLYTFWRRTTTPPNMMIFDTSTRDVCATRRQVTNTPLQPLVMLNDPQFVEAARKLGERILKEGGSTDESRASWAFREVLGKSPPPAQLTILLALVHEQREFFKSKSSNADAFLKIGDSKPDPALAPIETATFATLAQSLLNLDTNITLR